tara:strand:+ start:866 stop:1546 length:681 start_codon:yes stop_codon:yes gene_type:complete
MAINAGPDIVEDGLVLCLDAANINSYPKTGTTWTDLKGGNNGTLNNGVTFDAGNGGSFLFDGANEYAEFNGVSATSNATVMFWWNMPNGISDTNTVHHRMWSIDGNYECRTSRNPNHGSGRGSIMYDIGSTRIVYTARRNWDAGVWYSLALTHNYSENYLKIYTDGALTDSSTFVTNPNGLGSSLQVGGKGSEPMYGDIASFFIYNRALTAKEIKQNYEATVGRYV